MTKIRHLTSRKCVGDDNKNRRLMKKHSPELEPGTVVGSRAGLRMVQKKVLHENIISLDS